MNEVTIKLNNKDYNCILGLALLGELQEHYKKDVIEVFQMYDANPLKYSIIFLHKSIAINCELEGLELDLTAKQIFDEVLDGKGQPNKELQKFTDKFVKSIENLVPEEELEDSSKKK